METVVVGAKESQTAAKAVERAAEIAAALKAQLVIVTAYGSDVVEIGVGSDIFVASTAEGAARLADQTAARVRQSHGIETKWEALSGKPQIVMLEAAKRHRASIIVVGNVRMQGPGRFLGSVANHIAHHAPCDVYIVKTT